MLAVLLLVAAAAAAASKTPPPTQAACTAPTAMRVCDVLEGMYANVCEGADTCSLESNVPQNLTFALPGGVCRSRCLNDADCVARFGAEASCVRDGHAEGFHWAGSFCAVRVLDPSNADLECRDRLDGAATGRATIAVDGATAPAYLPDVPPLFAFAPCLNASSTTCVCLSMCVPTAEGGCADAARPGQVAYPAPGSHWNTSLVTFHDLYASPSATCPPPQTVGPEGLLCARDCVDGEPPAPPAQCGAEPACGAQSDVPSYLLVIDSAVQPAPGGVQAFCIECQHDADCGGLQAETSARCAPPIAKFADFVDPPPPQSLGYANSTCALTCVGAKTRDYLAAAGAACVAGRFGFQCAGDAYCAAGLQCLNPPERRCTLPCTSDAQCVLALGSAGAGDTPTCDAASGVCVTACSADADCDARYAYSQPPASVSRCGPEQQCLYLCKAPEDDAQESTTFTAVFVSVLVLIACLATAVAITCIVRGGDLYRGRQVSRSLYQKRG